MSSPGDEYHFDIPDSILSTVDLHAHWSASASTTTTPTSRPLQHLDVESPSQAGAMEDHLPISTSQASIIEEELVDSVLALMSPSNEPIFLDQDENVQDAPPVKDTRTPFQRHRKREFFSVSDLVGPLWCEVQYDYRLRSKPFLPLAQRPATITTDSGREIVVDKGLVAGHEKVMKRGEVVHKALEREIHPVEIKMSTTTREDVWGVRFLNMLASLEAVIGLGKCRELPVVGFVKGIMVVGVIDEIVRKPIDDISTSTPSTPTRQSSLKRSASAIPLTPRSQSKARSPATPITQRPLTAFFTAVPTTTTTATTAKRDRRRSTAPRTHRLFIRDNKTRANGTMPREENAQSGKMQLMLYKEMFDGMVRAGYEDLRLFDGDGSDGEESEDTGEMVQTTLPGSSTPITKPQASQPIPLDPFSFPALFNHLQLDADASFSETFVDDSHAIVVGNDLQCGAGDARTLHDMRMVWARYCGRLGVGDPSEKTRGKDDNAGRSEKQLALVYRHVEKKKKRRRHQSNKPSSAIQHADPLNGGHQAADGQPLDEETAIQLAIAASLEDQRKFSEGVNSQPTSQQQVPLADDQQHAAGPAEHDPTTHTASHCPELSQPSQMDVNITQDDDDEPLAASLFPVDVQLVGTPGEPANAPPIPDHDNDMTRTNHVDEIDDITMEPQTATKATESQRSPPPTLRSNNNSTSQPTTCDPIPERDPRIIGSHTFNHSARLLSAKLNLSLGFWMGRRSPVGVNEAEISRCGWCEFEEGCEWREKKAGENLVRRRQDRLARLEMETGNET